MHGGDRRSCTCMDMLDSLACQTYSGGLRVRASRDATVLNDAAERSTMAARRPTRALIA